MATRIFLSYRREDSADIAGRIFDHLERRFGRDRLFLDVDAIPYGDDFRHRIHEALNHTGVLLAIIGDRWLEAGVAAPGGRRLDDPDDYVSVEISSALERDITVVPVLVGEAQMPRATDLPARLAELSYRNAAEVRSGRDFSFQIKALGDAIADVLALPQDRSTSARHSSARLSISARTLADNPGSLVGIQLGAFVIERLLAAGGSGVAYVGRNPRTGQVVCVKVSLPVLSDMEAIRRALSRGIRGLVALNHPHIVRVHEFDGLELADARSFYVVMDYVDGTTLDEWVAALPRTREGLGQLVQVAYRIALALEAAHACRYRDDAGFETVGVMHGDVKPHNVLVRSDGTPAILDFMMIDINRTLDPAIRERLVTSDKITAVFGTPGFMAPEQESEGIVTVLTDVYGLGATLREVTGDLIVPGLSSLLTRMTGPRGERPQDMGEVARHLAGIARRNGLESEEMEKEQPATEKVVKRGLVATIASLFRRRASS
jgi:Protein kinase domain/TIR domain